MTLNDITIRTELKPGDLGYVAHLHGKLYFEEYQYQIQFEAYVLKGLAEFYEKYNPANSRVWVCEHNSRMVGFLLLMNRGETAQLRYFLIDPAYRGIGLGKKLVDLYMDFLKACGYKTSYLLTTHELPTAAHLYQKMGFRLIEQTESSAFGKKVYEQHYLLNL